MFEIGVEASFSAAHALRDYPGKCANVHGHNFRVQAIVRGEQLSEAGLLVDFSDLKRILRAICEELDHQFLNELEPFLHINPSSEVIARYIYQQMQDRLAQESVPNLSQLYEIRVWERELQYASYRE